mmetsp:Transcript_52896/g.158343  ORF Transcript_52896/g.158343 Transcript_52896/m.158343 type:complete len:203 (+) Transcript_52896:1823-2431(+)
MVGSNRKGGKDRGRRRRHDGRGGVCVAIAQQPALGLGRELLLLQLLLLLLRLSELIFEPSVIHPELLALVPQIGVPPIPLVLATEHLGLNPELGTLGARPPRRSLHRRNDVPRLLKLTAEVIPLPLSRLEGREELLEGGCERLVRGRQVAGGLEGDVHGRPGLGELELEGHDHCGRFSLPHGIEGARQRRRAREVVLEVSDG